MCKNELVQNISLHWHYPTGYKGLSLLYENKTYSQPFKAPLI